MRKMISWIAAIGALVATSAWCADAPASIVVSATNNVVASGNDIRLEVVMTNNSDAPIWLSHPPGAELTKISDFLVIGPDGKSLPQIPSSSSIRDLTLSELNPGEEIHELSNISRGYNMEKPGIYKILVTIGVRQEQNIYNIDSNLLSVTVTR